MNEKFENMPPQYLYMAQEIFTSKMTNITD